MLNSSKFVSYVNPNLGGFFRGLFCGGSVRPDYSPV